MALPVDDPRRALAAPTRPDVSHRLPRAPHVTEWVQFPSHGVLDRSQYERGQNFVVAYTPLTAGEAVEETLIPDEHIVLLTQPDVRLAVTGAGAQATLEEPGVVIMPPGDSSITADRDCTVLRVFSSFATSVVARAANAASYESPDPAVTPLPQQKTAMTAKPELHRMSDVPEDPTRLGRIFRTSHLMINWFAEQIGPRNADKLSPHVHDDFEQGSVTLAGDFIHHFRTPWTPRLSEWRADQAAACASPSVAIIPPGVVHTTRAVGEGSHQLIDVFAPPRTDFLERGWVLNAAAYCDTHTTATS
ncbi:hypothetical protein ABZ733_36070 [Streptomyces longwoodensis]|uniref:hypothetical protein n=1 Tax=Streptomyces longwoodensis TaxID=68231 RepID=UPI0033D90FDA